MMRYNGFLIRAACLVLMVGAVLFYDQAAVYRKNVEEFNRQLKEYAGEIESLNAEQGGGSSADGEDGAAAAGSYVYNDGTYEGSARGYGGNITLKVTVEQDTITNIEVTSAAAETPSYYNSAVAVIDSILEQQTPDVDAVSGATYSSNGIKNAVKAALSQAEK